MGCCTSKNYQDIDRSKPNYDYLLKCVLCGPEKTGKTKFTNTIEGINNPVYQPTIGVEFTNTMVKEKDCGTKTKLQIWDMAGDQRFRSIIKSYFRGTNLIFVFYSENEIDKLNEVLKELTIRELCSSKVPVVCVSDKPGQDLIQLEPNPAIEIEHKYLFHLDFSIKKNIEDLFLKIVPEVDATQAEQLQQVQCKKPAVYIYAKPKTELEIVLNTVHHISVEIPARINNKWHCAINDEQELVVNNVVSDYIYWEATENKFRPLIPNLKSMYEFVIRKSNYHILSLVMSKLLNPTELADFDEYWKPIFMTNPLGKIKVKFVSKESFDREFPLKIRILSTKKKINIERIELIFEESNDIQDVKSIDQIDILTIKSFYPDLHSIRTNHDEIGIIEWGGTIMSL
jgi:small GTP-binding protein